MTICEIPCEISCEEETCVDDMVHTPVLLNTLVSQHVIFLRYRWFVPVSWIRLGLHSDPDSALYLNADPDPGSQISANSDSEPAGQILPSQKLNIYIKNMLVIVYKTYVRSWEKSLFEMLEFRFIC